MYTTLCCKDIWIKKSEFAAKTQFLFLINVFKYKVKEHLKKIFYTLERFEGVLCVPV